eukprot:TRINITY_DN2616_c0_g1_i1.p3 TRINITY_DN2616_c0_g1~~TRINITY_DN2616_c0_g1_i1.p3  ORF type:complete len:531 (+),score=158.43 TRINITY_DN2616_c0_g1_i1:942-2534(+)
MTITFTPPIPSSPPSIVATPKPESENPKSSDTDALNASDPETPNPAHPDAAKRTHSPQPPTHPQPPAATTAPQPAPDHPNSPIAPSVVPPIPHHASVPLARAPSAAAAAAPRVSLRPRSKNRPGRPPNINENSLMRRLECVMAVDTGRMTMAVACQHYDISARTFYRWLRNKQRLIELTGFTEHDFKNGSPPAHRAPFPEHMHRMPPSAAAAAAAAAAVHAHPVAPRAAQPPPLPAQSPPAHAAHPPPLAFAPPMALKRRMPRIPHFTHAYDDRGLMQSQIYHRNTTKMPAHSAVPAVVPAAATDDGGGGAPKASASRALARSKCAATSLSTTNHIDVRDAHALYALPDADDGAVSPTLDSGKRRKIARGESGVLDAGVDDVVLDEQTAASFAANAVHHDCTHANGGGAAQQPSLEDAHTKSGADLAQPLAAVAHGVAEHHARAADVAGAQEVVQFVECSQKHKIEVVLGQKKVQLAWYHGATSADIKEAIAQRFSLMPGAQWALLDKCCDEIIVSDGMPSGRYQLTMLP